MIGIYKITSPSNRVYIGQTNNIKRRWNMYSSLNTLKKQPKIYNSIIKYGLNNHNFEIIEECEIGKLDEREYFYKSQFINEFGWDLALFCGLHDKGGGPRSQETKDKISNSKKGIKQSEETIKLKIKSLTRGKHCKAVYQYDLEGNFIKEWKFREDAEKEFNKYGNSNNISCCANNKQKSAYNYQWSSKFKNKIKPYKPYSNIITQYDLEGNFIKEWDSISKAEITFNPDSFKRSKYGSNNIRSCIMGRQITSYGFIWKCNE